MSLDTARENTRYTSWTVFAPESILCREGRLPTPHQKSIVTCQNWSSLISNEGLHQIEIRRIKEKAPKNKHDLHHKFFWPFQRKNSQSRWFGAKMSSLSQRYVICTNWIGFEVRKLKYSHKYNSSPIFFIHTLKQIAFFHEYTWYSE